jgi:tetratricopeptide (TPR) repeat protein
VPIKIDAEKGEGVEIAKRYGVRGYPTILLITAGGDEIDRLLGYMPPEPFLKTLSDYVTGKNTISTLKTALEKNPGDADAQYQMARKLRDRNDLAGASAHYKRFLALDPTDSLKHAEEGHFMVGLSALNNDKSTAELERFIQQYPSSPGSRQALGMLADFSIKEKKADDARKFIGQYTAQWPDDAMALNNFAWGCAEADLNLDQAAQLAAKAVSLATADGDKAMFLDTQATVAFKRGESDKAIALEQQALALLKDAPEKTRKQYEETLARFKAGKR